MSYISISIPHIDVHQSEILIALLSDIGFDGFEEEDGVLKAFIHVSEFDEEKAEAIFLSQNVKYEKGIVEQQNWNAAWESGYDPVSIEHPETNELFCTIQADFHRMSLNQGHLILINPKMSFGTGHHATTFLMMQELSRMDMKGKTMLDFGTGTGVLSILAEKMGAKRIDAVDCDDWSIENAQENIMRNECEKIVLRKGDTCTLLQQKYDVILANVIYSVIMQELTSMFACLKDEGILLLSGILHEDVEKLSYAIKEKKGRVIEVRQREKWILLVAAKNS